MSEDDFSREVLDNVMNAAEIEDIVVLCETSALYRRRSGQSSGLYFTREILDTAIGRVVVG
jgi:hypothetical protein